MSALCAAAAGQGKHAHDSIVMSLVIDGSPADLQGRLVIFEGSAGMKTILVTVALGAAALSAAAFAQAPGGERGGMQRDQTDAGAQQRADTMFQTLGANKDGTVTRAEAGQALARLQAMRGAHGGPGGQAG